MDIAVRTGLIDALASAADRQRGLSITELQEQLDLDSSKLCILLRLLSTKGWVHETSEGVFALLRPSMQLLKDTNGWKTVMYVSIMFIISH